VLTAVAAITAETAFLLITLGLRSYPPTFRRLAFALGVFTLLWLLDAVLVSGITHQPGHRYANGRFLLMVIGVLLVVLADYHRLRGRGVSAMPPN
jgi:hypothetical protein